MIKSISFRLARVDHFSRPDPGLVLQVTEDYDWGTDIHGMCNSLKNTRTRDAVPNDLLRLVHLGFLTGDGTPCVSKHQN